jgi:hypothetical protein
MELPSREKTFYFDHTGESGFRYEGHFTIKCRLNTAEKITRENEISRLLGDSANPTRELQSLALCLATCRVHVIDGPEWFKQTRGLLEDDSALAELYVKIMDMTDEWRKEVSRAASKTEEKEAQVGN